MRPILAAIIFPTLTACDTVCPPGFLADGRGECAMDEELVVDLMTRFDDGTLEKVNSETFIQVMGIEVERNVWISNVRGEEGEQALDLYRTISDGSMEEGEVVEFPVGTLVVHETVNREEGHTVQVKLGGDHEDVNGRDWWYGKFYDDGSPDLNACEPCWSCHSPSMRPTTDGLYGIPADLL